MTLSLELGGIQDNDVRRAFERISLQFPDVFQLPRVGDLKPTALAVGQPGWLLCDASPVTTANATNAALRAALIAAGSPYGTSGADPLLPDLRGRVPLGAGTAVGAAGATAHGLGSMGGEETHTLTAAQIPAHTHPSGGTGFIISGGTGNANVTTGGGGYNPQVNTGPNTGGDGAHNTLPPFTAVNWLIKV